MPTEFFKLDILSPVHIGTGDQLDPMGYLMRREGPKTTCHVLDSHAWVQGYPDPAELSNVFSGTNIPAMRAFLAQSIDPDIYSLRGIEVSREEIFREYEKNLTDQMTSKQLLISPHINSRERVPLIPGSSLKGSIRTAVIDWLDRTRNLGLKSARAEDPNGQEYRKRLDGVFGSIRDNAFKQLKIADAAGFADSTLLVEAIEVRRKEGAKVTPRNMCEVMPSYLSGRREHSSLFVKIVLGVTLQAGEGRLTLRDGHSFNWRELCAVVNKYYLDRFQEEKIKFYSSPNFSIARQFCQKIEAQLQPLPEQMVLRVGHYSQIEFVTVRNNQPTTRKNKQGMPMPYGTTRTLANGVFPFGWVLLTPCSEAEYRRGVEDRETANNTVQMQREVKQAHILEAKHQELVAKQQMEEDKRQNAELEQKRQAELDALPPEQRTLMLLERGSLNDNQVMEFFNQLDMLDPGMQKRAAALFKKRWMGEKRWTKKQCSKKQLLKVAKIKKILNEAD